MASPKLLSSPPKRSKRFMSSSTLISVADAASWYCALVLVALILFSYSREDDDVSSSSIEYGGPGQNQDQELEGVMILGSYRNQDMDRRRACDEIYVVQEGETLHTISDKCGDPYIVEQNPHIHDPDDVFPGLVIKITPNPIPIH